MSSKPLSWNALFLSGSIVSLSTGIWRARTKIRAADLDIDDTDEVKKALALGSHRLAPAKAFESVWEPARAARRAIDYYSVNFGLIKGARYVPEVNLEKLVAELRLHKTAFESEVAQFMADYEAMKEQHLPVIRQALLDAAPLEKAESAYQRILAEYPSSNEVRACFGLSWSIYAIKSPKSAEAGQFAADETAEVKSIVADMVTQLRGDMTEKLQAILEITSKGGKIPSRSVEAATALLDRIDSLNILGDEVLAEQVKAMRSAMTGLTGSGEFGAAFVPGLNEIKATLETSLAEAIADAERNLTGVGRRKLSLVEDAPEVVPNTAAESSADTSYLEMGL